MRNLTQVRGVQRYPEGGPDTWENERVSVGYLDPEQLVAIITRSYEYIRRLPLKNLHENYPKAMPELFSDS